MFGSLTEGDGSIQVQIQITPNQVGGISRPASFLSLGIGGGMMIDGV